MEQFIHLTKPEHLSKKARPPLWNVYFGPLKLGRLLERHMRIEDALGRLKRHNV